MAGHSKWANIKHKKAANDAKRSQIFSKMSRAITLAVREGGGSSDPTFNVRLRLAVERARIENMPISNIDRAISRAAGPDAAALKQVVYEGFGPGGMLLVIVATTDNPNRTNAEVRNALEKNGGKMGGVNSVLYQFEHCGLVMLSKESCSEEDVFALSEELGGLEIEEEDEGYSLYIPFDKLGAAHEASSIYKPLSIEQWYKPRVAVEASSTREAGVGGAGLRLIEVLEDLDDVEQVYSNIV